MKKKFTLWLLVICMFLNMQTSVFAGGQPVKNVIVLMFDGTGSSHTTLSRWYAGTPLALDEMISGAVRTYCADSIITDSAPAATAFATGHKSNSKYVGILPNKITIPGVELISDDLRYKPVATVLEGAKLQGKATGLIATSNIQHASPAGYSAHWPNRNDYNEIAEQQVYENIDVVFSAGKKYLLPKENGGERTDGENLIDILSQKGYAFIQNRDQLLTLNSRKAWGLFADDALAYEFDRRTLHPEQPSLAEMTKKAIDVLSQNKKGFFLFIEGSKVDWASHANDPVGVISDVLAFDSAVKTALDYAKQDGKTLVLAFSDHGNGGMSIGSKQSDKNYDKLALESVTNPLKKATLTAEGVEEMLSVNLSPSNIKTTVLQYYGIEDLTEEEISAIQHAKKGEMNYVLGPIISQRSYIGWTTNGHTGEDLLMYSYGPNRPIGLIENTDIAKLSAKALGFSLNDADKKLFVDAKTAFAKLGATITLDETDKQNRTMVVNGPVKAILPLSKNILILEKRTYELEGLVILVPTTGKIFLPQQALDIYKAAIHKK